MEHQQAKTSAGHSPSANDSLSSSLDHNKASNMEMIPAGAPTPSSTSTGDAGPTDPKKLRRILSNRESARRARTRKQEYEKRLEKEAKAAEERLAMLSSQVAYHRMQRALLQRENTKLKESIRFLEIHQEHNEAEYLELMGERERLVYIRDVQLQHQNGNASSSSSTSSHLDNI